MAPFEESRQLPGVRVHTHLQKSAGGRLRAAAPAATRPPAPLSAASSASLSARALSSPRAVSSADGLAGLQRQVGNAAASRMIGGLRLPAVQRAPEAPRPNRLLQQTGPTCWLNVLEAMLNAYGAPTTSEQILLRIHPDDKASSRDRSVNLLALAKKLEAAAESVYLEGMLAGDQSGSGAPGMITRADLEQVARAELGGVTTLDALDFLPKDGSPVDAEAVRLAYSTAAGRAKEIAAMHQDSRHALRHAPNELLDENAPIWEEQRMLGGKQTQFSPRTRLADIAAELATHRFPAMLTSPTHYDGFPDTPDAMRRTRYDFTAVHSPLKQSWSGLMFRIDGVDGDIVELTEATGSQGKFRLTRTQLAALVSQRFAAEAADPKPGPGPLKLYAPSEADGGWTGASVDVRQRRGDLPVYQGAHVMLLTSFRGSGPSAWVTIKNPNYGDATFKLTLAQFAQSTSYDETLDGRTRITSMEAPDASRRRDISGFTAEQLTAMGDSTNTALKKDRRAVPTNAQLASQLDAQLKGNRRLGRTGGELTALAEKTRQKLYI